MDYLEDIISSEELIEIAHAWADNFSVITKDEEVNELLEENFINGFLAGAIVIRDIVYKQLDM